jgi:myo-inositol-1(or 4)-monophosphatase
MPTLDPHISHSLFPLAVAATEKSSEILRSFFGKKVSIQTKELANFVSEADVAAEAAIVETIRSEFPGHAILAEEGHHEVVNAEHLWVIDPLDGTNNFLHGIPHFASSIGYYHRGQAELGIIHNPITNDWYYAARGQGAWQNDRRLRVNDETSLTETIVAVGFYYDRGKMMEATLEAIADFFRQGIHGVRRFGAAALDLAQVARGDYGVFMEFKLQPWDHAAGALLVHEAGGKVTDCLNRSLPIQHPSSILASNGRLHSPALAIASPRFQSL